MARDDRNDLAAASMDLTLRDAKVAAAEDAKETRDAAAATYDTIRDAADPVRRESADAARAIYDGLRMIRKA